MQSLNINNNWCTMWPKVCGHPLSHSFPMSFSQQTFNKCDLGPNHPSCCHGSKQSDIIVGGIWMSVDKTLLKFQKGCGWSLNSSFSLRCDGVVGGGLQSSTALNLSTRSMASFECSNQITHVTTPHPQILLPSDKQLHIKEDKVAPTAVSLWL